MKICIDFRETQLYTSCIQSQLNNTIYKNIDITSENLPLGDIIIYDNDGKEILLIERKTLSDLASSIQDNRYKEQCFRLSNISNIHHHNIIYLIEGDITKYYPKTFGNKQQRIDNKCIMSAMISIYYEKGFSIYKSLNVSETAFFILHTAYKIQKSQYKGFYNTIHINDSKNISQQDLSYNINNNNNNNSFENNDVSHNIHPSTDILKEQEYTSVVKRTKKNNITKHNIFSIMLSQIPGISYHISNIISEHFNHSIQDFINQISKNKKALDNIYITSKNGTKKKLSKKIINDIYSFLLKEYNEINIDI